MSFNQFNFKKEVIVFVLLWIICTLLIANSFSGNPYQGQSLIFYYSSLVTSSFYPALFLFLIYLAIWSIAESLIDKTKKTQAPVIEPEEPVN